jgi:hypothetical protein
MLSQTATHTKCALCKLLRCTHQSWTNQKVLIYDPRDIFHLLHTIAERHIQKHCDLEI